MRLGVLVGIVGAGIAFASGMLVERGVHGSPADAWTLTWVSPCDEQPPREGEEWVRRPPVPRTWGDRTKARVFIDGREQQP